MPRGGTLTIATENVVLDEAAAALRKPLRPGDHVRLTAADTGAGMDAETLEHVFEPFFTTKDEGKGTRPRPLHGLRHLTQSGGQVVAESSPGHGTTFESCSRRRHRNHPTLIPTPAASSRSSAPPRADAST